MLPLTLVPGQCAQIGVAPCVGPNLVPLLVCVLNTLYFVGVVDTRVLIFFKYANNG